jgi:hypothetical protein
MDSSILNGFLQCPACGKYRPDTPEGKLRHFMRCVEAQRAQNRSVVGINKVPETTPTHAPVEDVAEKDLQSECIKWLKGEGYMYLSPETFEQIHAQRLDPIGFYGVWYNSRKNCLCSDLLITAYLRPLPPLWVELKKPKGAIEWQPGQREAVELGIWKLAQSLDKLKQLVAHWRSGQ